MGKVSPSARREGLLRGQVTTPAPLRLLLRPGAAGLMLEVVWSKYLSFLLGNSIWRFDRRRRLPWGPRDRRSPGRTSRSRARGTRFLCAPRADRRGAGTPEPGRLSRRPPDLRVPERSLPGTRRGLLVPQIPGALRRASCSDYCDGSDAAAPGLRFRAAGPAGIRACGGETLRGKHGGCRGGRGGRGVPRDPGAGPVEVRGPRGRDRPLGSGRDPSCPPSGSSRSVDGASSRGARVRARGSKSEPLRAPAFARMDPARLAISGSHRDSLRCGVDPHLAVPFGGMVHAFWRFSRST
jgi:hypothetical protein